MNSFSLVLATLLPLTLCAQTPADSQRNQADSVVAFFLGTEVSKKYVARDTTESKRSASNSALFKYNFRHPKFSGEAFVIAFTLDSAGRFVPDQETRGLVRIESSNDSTWIAAQQALDICRDQARRIKKNSLRLVWDATGVSYDIFESTHNYRDIVPGNLVWQVDGEVLFRGERYNGTFEVNFFTGRVTRRFAIPWD